MHSNRPGTVGLAVTATAAIVVALAACREPGHERISSVAELNGVWNLTGTLENSCGQAIPVFAKYLSVYRGRSYGTVAFYAGCEVGGRHLSLLVDSHGALSGTAVDNSGVSYDVRGTCDRAACHATSTTSGNFTFDLAKYDPNPFDVPWQIVSFCADSNFALQVFATPSRGLVVASGGTNSVCTNGSSVDLPASIPMSETVVFASDGAITATIHQGTNDTLVFAGTMPDPTPQPTTPYDGYSMPGTDGARLVLLR